MSDKYYGWSTALADNIESAGTQTVEKLKEWSQDDPSTWTDDALRLGGRALQGVGTVASLPGIKQGLSVLGAGGWVGGKAGGKIAEQLKIDPRLGRWIGGTAGDLVSVGGLAKKTARVASSANKIRKLNKSGAVLEALDAVNLGKGKSRAFAFGPEGAIQNQAKLSDAVFLNKKGHKALDNFAESLKNDPAMKIKELDDLKEIEKINEAARKAELIKSGKLKPHPKGVENRLKTSDEAVAYYGYSRKEMKALGFRYNQYGESKAGNFKLKSLKLNQIEIDKRNLSIINVTDSEDMVRKGNKLWDAINAKGMEAHHIVPIHASTKLKELYLFKDKAKGIVRKNGLKYWNQRKARDAKLGIFHGNDPRNIVAVRGSVKTPKTTAGKRSTIYHRKGLPDEDNVGYHSLEAKWGTSIENPNLIDLTPYRDDMRLQQERIRKATKIIDDIHGKPRPGPRHKFKDGLLIPKKK